MPISFKTKALSRLSEILVEEVSLVDRAANKRKFLVIKRDTAGIVTLNKERGEELAKKLETAISSIADFTKSMSGAPKSEDGSVELQNSVFCPLAEAVRELAILSFRCETDKSAGSDDVVSALVQVAEISMVLAEGVAATGKVDLEVVAKLEQLAELLSVIADNVEPEEDEDKDKGNDKAEKANKETLEQLLSKQAELIKAVESLRTVSAAISMDKGTYPVKGVNSEKLIALREQRSKEYGIEITDKGSSLTFPDGYPDSLEQYGDPVNLRFPLDDTAHARSSRVRFKTFASNYTKTKSRTVVHERIVRAELKLGVKVKIDSNDPLDKLLPADLRDQTERTSSKKSNEPVEHNMTLEETVAEMAGQITTLTEQISVLISAQTKTVDPETAPVVPVEDPDKDKVPAVAVAPEDKAVEPVPAAVVDPVDSAATPTPAPVVAPAPAPVVAEPAAKVDPAPVSAVIPAVSQQVSAETAKKMADLEKVNKELKAKLERMLAAPPSSSLTVPAPVDKAVSRVLFPEVYNHPAYDPEPLGK